MSQQYAVLKCKDILTNREYVARTPQLLRSVKEDVDMYNRHNNGLKEFGYEIVETINSKYNTIPIESMYTPNPFNSRLKKERYTHTIIPKNPDDPRDLPWKITFDAEAEEKDWVESIINSIADNLYKQCLNEKTDQYKIYGSLCHHGFINHLFDYHHCSNMSNIRSWISEIGPSYEPVKISALKSYDSNSIYEGGFYCSDVRNLCIYCETMFGVSRYEVANLFTKRSHEYFMNTDGDIYKKAYNMQKVAAIYAENNNYNNSIEHYQLSVYMLEGKDS